MHQKSVRRLGSRLEHIFHWIQSVDEYDYIWDLCCDHGRLGLHLHQHNPKANIYLVDKVVKIVDKLIEDYRHLNSGRLHFQSADVCELSIPAEKRTLVILAGVGGQNTITMLSSILNRLSDGDVLEFILSPNAHVFELRQFLRLKGFELIKEEFVGENGFYHEHIWLGYTHPIASGELGVEYPEVSAVGESLWKEMTDAKNAYLNKLVSHYQRMLDNGDKGISKAALDAYSRWLM